MKPKHNDDIIRMMDEGAGVVDTAQALGFSVGYVSECRTHERERRAREDRIPGVLYELPSEDAHWSEWCKPISATLISRTLDGKPLHDPAHRGGQITHIVKRIRRILANG